MSSGGVLGTSQKSTIYVPNVEGGDDTEIVTHITVPTEGGWGWVVVAASFLCIFINDAVLLTFGAIFVDMRDNLKVSDPSAALINALAYSMSFFVGPIASAVINNYGFRECGMLGSVISCVSLLMTYYGRSYGSVLFFYGFWTGVGSSFVTFASSLVVGFYFNRLRALAVSIALTGTNAGCMVMYLVNSKLVDIGGWNLVVLVQSSMAGLIFFISMAYKPVKPLLVTQAMDEPATVLTSLPKLADKYKSATVQRMFNAVSNVHFPTAADVINTGVVTDAATAIPSSSKVSTKNPKYTLSTTSGGLSERQLKVIRSVTNPSLQSSSSINVELPPPKKKGFFARLFSWQKNYPEARPLYKDDIFYHGRINDLDVYKKSVVKVQDQDRVTIEYEMAVTRAKTINDIEQKAHLCSIATRRVLATMIDPNLLKCPSFSMLGISSFFAYLGVLVPYAFLQNRSEQQGLPASHCSTIISFIGFMNLIGKLIIGAAACKISPAKMYIIAAIASGIGIIALNFSVKLYNQYICAIIFGLFCSSLGNMRSLVLIKLFGLENLTNATGLMYIFQGVGSLISTPFSMLIKSKYGYAVSFYTAGSFLLISGVLIIPIQKVRNRELASGAR